MYKRYFLCSPSNLGNFTIADQISNFFNDKLHKGGVSSNIPAHDNAKQFWALNNISLDIQSEDVLGIIGKNGSGKSTLLKILSRITQPTFGTAVIKGRVGSLLEVGTGFHPELTGRENIYLAGSILGLPKKDINAYFDEIVNFSEIDTFLDTPVKRYSSGMYVRLGFAVAAHLNPDILIIDEVLAVGDIKFQKKCLEKISNISKSGNTVLFVSHNMPTVSHLCNRCILLDQGNLVASGEPREVISEYFDLTSNSSNNEEHFFEHKGSTGDVLTKKIFISDDNGNPKKTVFFGETINLYLEIQVLKEIKNIKIMIYIERIDGINVNVIYSEDASLSKQLLEGIYSFRISFKTLLIPDKYYLGVAIKQIPGYWGYGPSLDWIERAYSFEIMPYDENNNIIQKSESIEMPFSKWELLN